MMSQVDVAIIGAGIVGAACARALAGEGLRVAVYDKDTIGGGTTGAGMGHVVVMDDSEAQFALTAYSRSLWHDLAAAAPPQMEFSGCGTVWVAADDEEMEEVSRKLAFYSERGVAATRLDAHTLYEHEPHLRPGLAGGLLVPDDAVVYPPVAAAYLLDQARELGAEVHTKTAVTRVADGRIELANGTEVQAEHVVNAAGCDAPGLASDLPIRKRKGHLVITETHPGLVNHQLVELGYLKSAHAVATDSVAFNLQPRPSGQILIGSSRQFDAPDGKVEPAILGRMLERARLYMPALENVSVLRCWTGFRPATPDKLPLVGPHPHHAGLWIATGHEGLGITTSLGTAGMLTDLVLGRTPDIDATPYLPARLVKRETDHV